MTEVRVIHLGLDILASPLWAPGSDGLLTNVPVEDSPLSASLQEALTSWAERYDSHVDEFGSVPRGVKQSLHEDGVVLWQQAVHEIGDSWTVHFDSPVFGESNLVHVPSSREIR